MCVRACGCVCVGWKGCNEKVKKKKNQQLKFLSPSIETDGSVEKTKKICSQEEGKMERNLKAQEENNR